MAAFTYDRTMAARLYLRGRIWWASFYRDGVRQQRSTRCTSRKAADRVAAGFEVEAADIRISAARSVTIQRALEEFVADVETRGGRSEGTKRFYLVKCTSIARALGADTPLAKIDAKRIDAYIAQRLRQVSRHTVAHELGVIRQTLRVARRRGDYHLSVDEVMPVHFDRSYQPKKDFLTQDEVDRLLAQLLPHRAAHVAFLAATGASWGPSTRARREDVDLDRGLIFVRGTKRASRLRLVPILDHTRLWAEMARDGAEEGEVAYRPWKNARHDLECACRNAGVPRANPNMLRHSWGEWLREIGVSTDAIGAAMGHTDSRMVERVYTHLDGQRLASVLLGQISQRQNEDLGL